VKAAWVVLLLAGLQLSVAQSFAEVAPPPGGVDSRIRVATYDADQVYRLHGFIGYQIDLEFEAGESFVGLGAGDIDALSFVGKENHLFLKPRALRIATNITVLTNRRHYQFEYSASAHAAADASEVIYVLRFAYPPGPAQLAAQSDAKRLDETLKNAAAARPRNVDYWYCGDAVLKPTAASDDGVHTRLTFAVNAELPAVFVRNDDGVESLLNFSMDEGDVVIHRVARRLILRRGALQGCVVNQAFTGASERLKSGTVAPNVERRTREIKND
jgi:type IV secretion system protein VirB9